MIWNQNDLTKFCLSLHSFWTNKSSYYVYRSIKIFSSESWWTRWICIEFRIWADFSAVFTRIIFMISSSEVCSLSAALQHCRSQVNSLDFLQSSRAGQLSSLQLTVAGGFWCVSIRENVCVLVRVVVITVGGGGVAGVHMDRPEICRIRSFPMSVLSQSSYLSKGQGLTRDTLEDVTDADDLWLQSLDRKKPDKKPRTKEARPVSRAIVTACNSKDHCQSFAGSLVAHHGLRDGLAGRVRFTWCHWNDIICYAWRFVSHTTRLGEYLSMNVIKVKIVLCSHLLSACKICSS